LIINTLFKLSSTKIKFFLFLIFIVSTIIGQNPTTKSELTSFYRYIPEKMTWSEHKKQAVIMGGDLACITNAYENEQVRRIAGGEIVWIGGVRRDCGNGTGPDYWKWSDGKEWAYTNWRQGEPNNYSEHDENRVMFWENGEWNDASLLHKFSAVYEIPSGSKDILDGSKTKQNKINHDPLIFYKFIPEKMTWSEHKKLAIIMGGDLACITNAYENEQVRRTAGGEIVWLGGLRKGCGNDTGADHWYWSNGKKWSYTNWRQGEPNNYSEHDENRVMFWENGEWNDASLLHKFSAVYELPIKNDSVDYFENNEIKTKESNKIKRNPFRTILGSVLSTGTVFTVREINLTP